MKNDRKNRFSTLDFEDFKAMAKDQSLSKYEKIGFPDQYRLDKEDIIFEDIISKISNPERLKNSTIFDIGSGCSDIPQLLSKYAHKNKSELILIDSKEMLELIPDDLANTIKQPGHFPDLPELLVNYKEKVQFILCYSVIQYIFENNNLWRFIDECLGLLAPGGSCLLGDIPNESKRKRFFSSQTGIEFHKNYMKTNEAPSVTFNQLEKCYMDDSVVMSIIQRCRIQGFDAYIVPQGNLLPMSNRREDIIIVRP